MGTMQPPANAPMQDPSGGAFNKQADSAVQALAVMHKLAAQSGKEGVAQAMSALIDAVGEAENQFSAPPEDPNAAVAPAEGGEEMIPSSADQGLTPPSEPDPSVGSFEDASAQLHAATQEDARRRPPQ